MKRRLATINAELANLCRDLEALPRPVDLDEASRIRARMRELVLEESAESAAERAADHLPATPGELGAQALNLLADVHDLLVQAFGEGLTGQTRGPLASAFYLARVRDRLLGHEPARPVHVCADCIELRGRLRNIYHLTLTYDDAGELVRAVREASGPGAPAPASAPPQGGERA